MKRVIVTPNPYRDRGFQTVRSVLDVLHRAGIETRLCLPFEVDRSYELPRDLRFSRLERELSAAEGIVCLGGDGTILHMAKTATRNDLPLLGVNIGSMGFMAELESTEVSQLARLASGDYTIDLRMMLDVTVRRAGETIYHDVCLNDVVITKGTIARIIRLCIRCDGIRAMECGGDGVIFATPTGSTAYSLASGGPIVEPGAHNILITPICAHDTVSRCIVTSDERVITAEMCGVSRRNAYLSADGGKSFRLSPGDTAIVRKSELTTKLIHLTENSFFDVVAAKFRNT